MNSDSVKIEDTKDDHGKDDMIEKDVKKVKDNVVAGHTVDSDDEGVTDFLRKSTTTYTRRNERMSNEKTRPPPISEGLDNTVPGAYAVEGRAVGSMPAWAALASRNSAPTPASQRTSQNQNQNNTRRSTTRRSNRWSTRWSNRSQNASRRGTYRWSLFGHQDQGFQEEDDDSWDVGSMPVWATQRTEPSDSATATGPATATATRTTPVSEGTNGSQNTTRRSSTQRSSNFSRNTTRRSTQRWSLFGRQEQDPQEEDQNPQPGPALVTDEVTAHSVSDAVPIVYPNEISTSDELEEKARKDQKKQRMFWIGVAVLVALVGSGIGIAVGTMVTNENNSLPTESPTTESPTTESPSMSPTTTGLFIRQCQIHNKIVDINVVSNDTKCFYKHLKTMTEITLDDSEDFIYSCNSSNLAMWFLAHDNLTHNFFKANKNVSSLVDDSCGTNFTADMKEGEFRPPQRMKISGDVKPKGKKDGGYICAAGPSTESFDKFMDQVRQRYGLVAMYLSLGGDNWSKSNNWLDDTMQECEWEGVVCANKKLVTSIKLQTNNLIGQFPQEIKYISKVQHIYLHDNHITGTLPETIWSDDLKQIRHVDLSKNKMSGTIPNAFNFASVVKSGTDEKSFDKRSAYIEFWEDFLNQRDLDWEAVLNQTVFDLEAYLNQTDLDLEAVLNQTDFDWEAYHNQIELDLEAYLNQTDFDLEAVLNQTELDLEAYLNQTDLDLEAVLNQTDFDWEAYLNQTELDLEAYLNQTDLDLEAVLNQTDFDWEAYLNQADLDLEAYLNQTDLDLEAVLNQSDFDWEAPTDVFQLALKLSVKGIGEIGPHEIDHLDLSDNDFTGLMPLGWGLSENLRHLNLKNNNLSGPLTPPADDDFDTSNIFQELEEFIVSNNSLTGTISPKFGNFKDLHTLDLSYNNLNGSIPALLHESKELQVIDVKGNKNINGPIPSELTQIRNLQMLNIEGTSLNGTIPDDFCDDAFLRAGVEVRFDCNSTLDTENCKCCCCPGNETIPKNESSR